MRSLQDRRSAPSRLGPPPGGQRAAIEALIADRARAQHGVVTRAQLLAVGVSSGAVEWRLKVGAFSPLHRGVYRVGPVESPHTRLMAACLACGPPAVVSHRSAGTLWAILPSGRPRAAIDVTVRGCLRRHRGVRVRQSRTLRDDDITARNGIPVTSPLRTLVDLAGTVGVRGLERAVAEALALRLTTTRSVRKALTLHEGRPGIRDLRAALGEGQPAWTRSEAEERFLALIRKARLDPPSVNALVEGREVDFLWRARGLVVEIDGFAFHSSRTAFENDRRRDAVLAAAGLTVVRVTWRQLIDEPEAVLVRLTRALAVGGPS